MHEKDFHFSLIIKNSHAFAKKSRRKNTKYYFYLPTRIWVKNVNNAHTKRDMKTYKTLRIFWQNKQGKATAKRRRRKNAAKRKKFDKEANSAGRHNF